MIPAGAVSDLVPFAHVTDVDRSVASTSFYERLGFEMLHEALADGRRVWAFLERGDARLMVAEADGAFDPEAQGIIFYLYTRDLDALRAPGSSTTGSRRARSRRAGPGPTASSRSPIRTA